MDAFEQMTAAFKRWKLMDDERTAALSSLRAEVLASADVFETIIRNAGPTLDAKASNALQCAATRLRAAVGVTNG